MLAGEMKAVLLAGGKGSRLLPYTAIIPKPLMPIGERPGAQEDLKGQPFVGPAGALCAC